MARMDDDAGGTRDERIVREARRRFDACKSYEASARDNAKADYRFKNGDSYNNGQWEAATVTARAGRPCLTQNKVRQHVLQIVNEAKLNKAAIKVTPTGAGATYEAAQVLSGCVRRIEYQSKATDAYTAAMSQMVTTGVGYCRVDIDYTGEESFEQDLFIRHIPNPDSVYLDRDALMPDKSDMRYAFVFRNIPRDEYEAEHRAQDDDETLGAPLGDSDEWDSKTHVREAEYWRKQDRSDTLHRLQDGRTFRESDVHPDLMTDIKPLIVDSREVSSPEIEWFKIVGSEIVERDVWKGRYIPIVPFIGEETYIDGTFDRKGHVRAMIDPQRIYNAWCSASVEFVALQTKTPYLAPAQAIEGYEDDWEGANVQNKAVLLYNHVDDSGRPMPPPQRAPAPQMAQAYMAGLAQARSDMEMVTGQYEASFGQPSNERSGVAIEQRQRAGDKATYHYIDNQAKAIRQLGRVVLNLIPKVYSEARVIKILAEDEASSDVHVDPNAQTAHQHVAMTPQGPQPITSDQADQMANQPNAPDVRVIFNPGLGSYDVQADVGPAFSTRRQEQFHALSQIMASNKEAMTIGADLMFKAADFPSADELAKRFKAMVPPQALGGPSPDVTRLQQSLATQHAEITRLQQQLDAANVRVEQRDQKLMIEDYRAETDRLRAIGQQDPAVLQLIIRRLYEDMVGTPIAPQLQAHAALEQTLQPPAPPAQQQGQQAA